MTRYLMPLAIFLAMVAALAAGLRHDPRELPSALVGKPAPAFALPSLAKPDSPAPGTRQMALSGQVWMLNVWASWCTACRTEHAALLELAAVSTVPLYGLNYKDEIPAARNWLRQMGDPYVQSFVDSDGRVGMDFGVYGVPETFVIDGRGIVRFRHAGPVTHELIRQQLAPLLERVQAEASHA